MKAGRVPSWSWVKGHFWVGRVNRGGGGGGRVTGYLGWVRLIKCISLWLTGCMDSLGSYVRISIMGQLRESCLIISQSSGCLHPVIVYIYNHTHTHT